jgi:hypothetical protein
MLRAFLALAAIVLFINVICPYSNLIGYRVLAEYSKLIPNAFLSHSFCDAPLNLDQSV